MFFLPILFFSGSIQNDRESYFVCYSTHASYTEGVDLIKFLNPRAIEPCVLRFDEKLDDQIYTTIRELLRNENEPNAKKPKLFNLRKLKNVENLEKSEKTNYSSNINFKDALKLPAEM